MKNEVIDLLKKEGWNSDEIRNANVNAFADLIKEIGKRETKHIKASEISKNLKTNFIGKDLYIFNEVGSTNTIAKYLSENDVSTGSAIISEKQTGGKGRSGKSWQSPLGGIWLSIILNPNVDSSKIPIITLATGVAVERSLEKIGIENPEIKWPNDILIDGKKVCGILTEAITKLNSIETVIVGVGIDVNLNIKDFPEDLQKTTTSIEHELGKRIDENQLIKIFFEEFEKIYELYSHEKYEEILKEWRKSSYSIGKIVEVKKPYKKPYDAYVVGISNDGALVVEKYDGTLEKVISGECTIKN